MSGQLQTIESIKIMNADSKHLDIGNNSVALTITSPYYRNAIDYQKHLEGGYYRERASGIPIEQYVATMSDHFKEVWRVSKQGAYCCIVIGNELVGNGQLISLPSHFILLMERLGWILQDELIWYKITGGKKRFRVTVQNPFASYYYPNILHEQILIFRKGDICHRRENELDLNDFMKKEVANSVWHIPPVPPNQYPHPCPFPEDIPYRLINLYSYPNSLVLDNFNGIGTTTKVAYHLKRRAIGYDIVKEYCDIARQRLSEPLKLRIPIVPKWVRMNAAMVKPLVE